MDMTKTIFDVNGHRFVVTQTNRRGQWNRIYRVQFGKHWTTVQLMPGYPKDALMGALDTFGMRGVTDTATTNWPERLIKTVD